MTKILTADQFVAGLIAVLALKDRKHFVLKDSELDEKFEHAFDDLLTKEDEFGITTNFTFYTDPLHGDSVSLRETLLAAREKELISLNNPTFHTFEIKLDDRRAQRYLENLPLPRMFLNEVVDKYFAESVS